MWTKYIVRFLHPETNKEISELLETETTRRSKVLKQVDSALQNKYQKTLEEIKDLTIYAIR